MPARPTGTDNRFGRNTAMIALHFVGVGRLRQSDIERLIVAQRQVEAGAFFAAWHTVANDDRRFDRLAFQHTVSAGYGASARRIEGLKLELAPAARNAFAHAVIGRALALFGYPDLEVNEVTTLSRAWTTVRG